MEIYKPKSFFLILFVYYYPVLLTFLLPFFINKIHFETDLVENFIFSSFLLIVSILYLKKKKIIVLGMLFLLYLIAFIETVYLILFKSYFTSSSIFIFFESNTSEINSFIEQYGSNNSYFIGLSLLVFYILFAYFFIKEKFTFSIIYLERFRHYLVFKIILLASFLLLVFSPLHKSFFPVVVVKAIVQYSQEMNAYEKMKFNDKSDYFKDVYSTQKDTLSETYVLVLGESTTRNHLGIYEYYRQTTPLMQSISDELLIYKDVVTPNTHTLTALEKVLTLGSTENLNLKYEGNILQLFNQAGFSTYWISNQRPTGIWDNFITGIANSAQHKFFFNISDDKSPNDSVLLESFKKVLNEKNKKKLIVLHLMGTHMLYKDRYSVDYERFKDKPKTIFNTKVAEETINSYDNAVLYQDYIWFTIIDVVKKKNEKSAVLILSDHGEEVYDSIDFSGHTETKGTKSMYDIPFVLWLSKDKIEEKNNLIFDINRSYSTENLIFTMADLASLQFEKMDKTKSILSKEYKRTKRYIFNNQTYDEFFKK